MTSLTSTKVCGDIRAIRTNTCVGPVRGIDFHSTQPLFVSGGDDYRIKVWNYQLRRCLFTLTGHLDYIRTVQFHHESPWIVSASDDQTIRIWNWQSRTCLSVLTGHNHYVMCVRFHPREDLIVSASLDQTVRVWDISGLRKKSTSAGLPSRGSTSGPMSDLRNSGPTSDFFGTGDVVVKYVLEGHTRGVNWVSFHPKMPLLVSGADDREVKLWRMSDSKAWDVDTFRGHVNNVSSVVFHPNKDLIISNSEDRSIRVWDMSRQASPSNFRREADRYWILAAHPTKNLLASGHDTGLVVFKLQRERPAYDCGTDKSQLFYCKDRFIRAHNLSNGKDVALFSTRSYNQPGVADPRTMYYNSLNPNEHNFLLISDSDGGTYELYTMKKGVAGEEPRPSRGLGASVCFVSRNRFAVLDHSSKQIYLKSMDNETKKKIDLPNPNTDAIFPAGIGRILCRAGERMILFDLQTKQVITDLMTTNARHPIKYVSWSRDRKFVALMSKFTILICSSKLTQLAAVTETTRIKSGVWDPSGVFVYTTSTHIKYSLTCGDNGIIRTLDDVVYLTGSTGSSVTFLDREGECLKLQVDTTEAMFKKALVTRDLDQVLKIVQSNSLIGHSVIAYLQKKGYPDVALHFVQDEKTKFNLALQCGNLAIARECAKSLNDKDVWHALGEEALRQGDLACLESAYQKTKNFEKLAFLYLTTGQMDKLSKMLEIARHRQDIMGRFHTALYLGDVDERVAVLKEAEQAALAFVAASVHGIHFEDTEGLLNEGVIQELSESLLDDPKLFIPPQPILRQDDWPKHEIRKGYFDDPVFVNPGEEVEEEDEVIAMDTQIDLQGWGEEEDSHAPSVVAVPELGDDISGGWGDFGDLGDMDGLAAPMGVEASSTAGEDYFVMPTAGADPRKHWRDNASSPLELIASGTFDMAMQSLNRSMGIVNFAPLKPHFLKLYSFTHASARTLPGLAPIDIPLQVNGVPFCPISIELCVEKWKIGYKMFTAGSDLAGVELKFRELIHLLTLLKAGGKVPEKDIFELLSIAREYVTATRIEISRRATTDRARQVELGAMFVSCKLQPLHMFLGLQVVIRASYEMKNYNTAGYFCRRFLEMTHSHKLPSNMQKAPEQVCIHPSMHYINTLVRLLAFFKHVIRSIKIPSSSPSILVVHSLFAVDH